MLKAMRTDLTQSTDYNKDVTVTRGIETSSGKKQYFLLIKYEEKF